MRWLDWVSVWMCVVCASHAIKENRLLQSSRSLLECFCNRSRSFDWFLLFYLHRLTSILDKFIKTFLIAPVRTMKVNTMNAIAFCLFTLFSMNAYHCLLFDWRHHLSITTKMVTDCETKRLPVVRSAKNREKKYRILDVINSFVAWTQYKFLFLAHFFTLVLYEWLILEFIIVTHSLLFINKM